MEPHKIDPMARANRNRREGMGMVLMACDGSSHDRLVEVWSGYGGRVRFSGGAYLARMYGITASCTISDTAAVKAWLRKARAELEGAS
jgi:hypothetical protein